VCYFWISTVKVNEIWLLVFKTTARSGFLALGSNEKTDFDLGEQKLGLPLSGYKSFGPTYRQVTKGEV
jgi:hypothetical protein